MFQLGMMTQDGDGGPKDDAAAKAWFEKPPRSIMAVRWSGLTPTRKTAVPGQRRQRGARPLQEIAALGDEDARASLQRLRCPFTLKDKNGKVAGSICYDGDD